MLVQASQNTPTEGPKDVLHGADLYVADRLSQCERLGELQHVEQELRQGVVYGELGDLVSGRKAGRTAADQITVCDLTGTGAQDTAIALFALEKAEELGLGLEVNPAIPISRVWADPKR